MSSGPKVIGIDLAFSHLIAIDRQSGTLWGGVEMQMGGRLGDFVRLARCVMDNVGPSGVGEYDAETDDAVMISGSEIWNRCDVYKVILSDNDEEAPIGAPLNAQLIYSGHEMGWLPEEKSAAWGVMVRKL